MTIREAFEQWLYTVPVETFQATNAPLPEPEGLAFIDEIVIDKKCADEAELSTP